MAKIEIAPETTFEAALQELETLLKEMEQKVLGPSRDLEKRFIQLNQGYLKFPELEYQNAFRMRKINQTVSSLRRML